MKSLIRWSISNTPAMNTLMVGILLVGGISLYLMRREVFPEFELEIIQVSVPYPGASPSEVEEGVCQKIEEAVRSVDGIKTMHSVARESMGSVILELESEIPDVQRTLNEVRSEIDRIPSLPELTEEPEIKQITLRKTAIRVGILAPESEDPRAEVALREVAERVRDDLLQLSSVSQAEIVGTRAYQIDVEISEKTLREYGLTLQEVAQILRRKNVELPGGSMKTESEEVLLRGKNKRLRGEEIAKIPLITQPGGATLTVGDLGTVRDEFTDTTAINRINGQPGLVISVNSTSNEDLLVIVAEVKKYLATLEEPDSDVLPEGYKIRTWADISVHVRDRMELLTRNGLQGLVLVFLVLAIFLELRLSFWVALGIPISILGCCAVMLYGGQTLNMLSMFAFLMALGILVDDGIVVGENIYAHRQRGSGFVKAAIDGTVEVLPSVAASVTTTMIAFAPLLFVPGVMGKFIAVMPVAVIAMLMLSLVEVTLILPCHLAHGRKDVAPKGFMRWVNRGSNSFLQWAITRAYMPLLQGALKRPAVVLATAAAVLLMVGGLVRSGITPFVAFPKLDGESIVGKVVYPDGTPAAITERAAVQMEAAILELDRESAEEGMPLVKIRHLAVGQVNVGDTGPVATAGGSHVGSIGIELVAPEYRTIDSNQILAEWRKRATDLPPGYETLSFTSVSMGPGGTPIELQLLGTPEKMELLESAVQRCKEELAKQEGVFDVADNSRPGKWEYQLKPKPGAEAMNVDLASLAGTVRAAYYGEEVMRLQRGRHEVKLMVRYPVDERRSMRDFNNIRVRTGDRSERPLTELATKDVQRGYSQITRVDQMRAITITADVDESKGNAKKIVKDFKNGFLKELLEEPQYAGIAARWEGQEKQTAESIAGLLDGLVIALVAMFALLTLEFRSYAQPLIILAIVPFGAVGAVVGHALMGLPLTLFSLFGLVALTGVVVNDSIVLIDFINRQVRADVPVKKALLDAGRRRFRPVLLTSITTVVGLLPILLETSFQAQVLIPMAVSLCFGLLFATVLVLLLVPTLYLLYYRICASVGRPVNGISHEESPEPIEPFRAEQPAQLLRN